MAPPQTTAQNYRPPLISGAYIGLPGLDTHTFAAGMHSALEVMRCQLIE